jgi:hypothetical protein
VKGGGLTKHAFERHQVTFGLTHEGFNMPYFNEGFALAPKGARYIGFN